MQPNDLERFCEILNGLAAIKPGKELTSAALKLWWNAMQSWSIEEFAQAAEHLAGAIEFMPNPYHFQQLRQAGQPTPGEAWEMVISGQPLTPGSRVERAARMLGGQRQIRHADTQREIPHVQRRFIEFYEDLCDVDPVRQTLPAIALPSEQRTLISESLKALMPPVKRAGQ